MKKTRSLLALAVTIPLLVLQFSCATVEKKQVEEVSVEKPAEMPTEAEKAPEVKQLLADTHKAAGSSCKDCHVKPPKDGVQNDVCLTCHGNYKELAVSNLDPHNAHYKYSSCGDCHHAHKPSETQCLSCHTFDLQAP